MAIEPTKTITFSFETVNGATLKIESRFLSSRQSTEHRKIIDSMTGKGYRDTATLDAVDAAMSLAVVDWSRGKYDDELTDRELVVLAANYPQAVYAAESEIAAKMGNRITVPGRDEKE